MVGVGMNGSGGGGGGGGNGGGGAGGGAGGGEGGGMGGEHSAFQQTACHVEVAPVAAAGEASKSTQDLPLSSLQAHPYGTALQPPVAEQ